MEVKAWNDGSSTYGIRAGIPIRGRYFDRSWSEVELDGQCHRFARTPIPLGGARFRLYA